MKRMIRYAGRAAAVLLLACLWFIAGMLTDAGPLTGGALADGDTAGVYWIMVSVKDLTSENSSLYTSCANSAGFIRIPTKKQDGSDGPVWEATVREKDWDTENGTVWYTGGCQGGSADANGSAPGNAISGFPTELILEAKDSPVYGITQYIKNNSTSIIKNQAKIRFTIWISKDGSEYSELQSWDETVSKGMTFNAGKTVSSSKTPQITALGSISGPSSVRIPKKGQASSEFEYSASLLDQYGVKWYQENIGVEYSLSGAPDGISIDTAGKLTVSPDTAKLETFNGDFNIALRAYMPDLSGAGTAEKTVEVKYPLLTVRYNMGRSENNAEYVNYSVAYGTAWVKDQPLPGPFMNNINSSDDDHWKCTSWIGYTEGMIITEDITFQHYGEWEGCTYVPTGNYSCVCSLCGRTKSSTLLGSLSGYGKQKEPFLIQSADDWNTVEGYAQALNVNTISGYFRLTTDITVTKPIGTEKVPFTGKLNGDGHTLNCSITADNAAPFAYAYGITLQNLNVTGSIRGTYRSAGLVGMMQETYRESKFESCTVNASVSGGLSCGGFVADAYGPLSFTNCVFGGSMENSEYSMYACTALAKTWKENLKIQVSGFLDASSSSVPVGIGSCGDGKLEKIYYIHPKNNPDSWGVQVYSVSAAEGVALAGVQGGVSANGTYYAAPGDKVTVSVTPRQADGLAYKLDSGTLALRSNYDDHTEFYVTLGSGNSVLRCVPDLNGSGTAEDPWQVGSADNWNAVAAYLEAGFDTSDKYFLQTADFTVTAMCGSKDHPMSGHYNGGGCTLTFGMADAPNDCAPFSYIQGAAISNLHTAGTIGTNNRWAAGLAANALGSCSITNCRSSVRIESGCSGDGSHAGFVSVIAEGGSLAMTGCAFDGAITGTETKNCAGFVAYARNMITIRNSVCAPSAFEPYSSQTFARQASGCTVSIENSYYTDAAPVGQGQRGYSVTADENVDLDFGEGTVYTAGGITAYPAGIAFGGVFRAGEGETVSMTLECSLVPADGFIVEMTASSGILAGTDQGYSLTLAGEPSVISAGLVIACLAGSGTAEDPWQVDSAEHWDTLASAVDFSTAGRYFLLTKDISVTTMLGSNGQRFMGVFDGGGHTLEVSLSAESAAAPFAGVSGATIRNLRVTGTVTGSNHSAGLVAGAAGTNLIENCAVSTSVTCTGSHCGGIVGHGTTSHTTLRGCVFSGSTSGATRVGTLWGWSDSGARPVIEYCLDVSDSPYPVGLGYDDPSGSLVCVYYTHADKQPGISRPWQQPGKPAHTITAGAGVTINPGNGTAYSVSGITAYTGSAVLGYGGMYFAGVNERVSLLLAISDGYMPPVVAGAAGIDMEGERYSMAMPDADVVLSATPASVFDHPDFILPAMTEVIEAEAFSGVAVSVVDIPESCTFIGDYAFRNCGDVVLIRIPADCVLGRDVFDGCGKVYVFGYIPGEEEASWENCVFMELAAPLI